MIEESLFKVNQIGKDGFIWWLGQVAPYKSWKCDSSITNYQDENKASKNWPERCKVRIIGYHPFRKSDLSDDDLPWAHVLMDPAFGSGQGGEGMTHNLMGGETCFGFFLDGDDAQQPVIVGLLHRQRNIQNLEQDDEFAFQPFTGHPKGVPSTKRAAPRDSVINLPGNSGTPGSVTPPPPPSGTVEPLTPNQPQTSSTPTIRYQNGFWEQSLPEINPGFYTGFSAGIGISLSNFLDKNYVAIGSSLFNIDYGDTLWEFSENAAQLAFFKNVRISYTSPSECHKNTIGQITQALQDFIGFTNGLQKYGNTYIDPILNEVVDITNSIKSVAYSIGGIIRLVINSIRSGLIKCLLSLFKKLIGFIVPDAQQAIVAESANNLINIIYCLFEKLMPLLLEFIERLLTDMVDSVFSAPICAIEQWVSGILTNAMATIEEAIEPIISGVSWLTGGLGSIYSILNNASNLASQIYSFIGCDELKCTAPSKWVTTFGPSQMEADNWENIVNQVNIISGVSTNLTAISDEIAKSSFYGQSFDYSRCNQLVNNPISQDDLPFNPLGTRLNTCIPPIISIYGDGIGAKLSPRISNKGSLLSVDILSPGFGYTYQPNLTVIDKSGYGSGARIEAIIDKNGSIKDVLIIDAGRGYCKPKILDKNTGIGNTDFDIYENLLDECPDEEIDETPEDFKFNLTLKTTKRKIYEGESFTIIINSTNKVNPKRVRYQIEGVTKNDIQQNLEGVLELKDGETRFKIDTIPNEVKDTKKIRFLLKNYNKYVDIIIEDISESDLNKKYKLISNKLSLNEGSSFTIELKTKEVPDGTVVPFKISGVSDGLIQNKESYVNFAVVNNQSKLKFNTNKGVILNDQLFELELLNKEARIAVIINSITSSETSGEDRACIRELIVRRPGIGYNITDTATDGINTYELIISPDNGAIFGVKPLPQDVCGFTDIPFITINTNTGVGAEILPVMKTDNTNSSGITILSDKIKEPIKVVDCI